jgi:hypothetical protein
MPRVGFKTFFNSSKKNSFGRAANKKIWKAKDLSMPPSTLPLHYAWSQHQ